MTVSTAPRLLDRVTFNGTVRIMRSGEASLEAAVRALRSTPQ
jgi:hypothetical protein